MLLKVSIVIPTLNEAENLKIVLPRIPKLKEIHEIILLDGHSIDDTIKVAKRILPDIKIVFQKGKGKGDAINCAAQVVKGDYFLVLDSDGSQLPEEIPIYIDKAKEGFDLVKGSRFLPGAAVEEQDFLRNWIVKTANIVANLCWGTRFTDICYGMFLINTSKYKNLNISSTGFNIEWELMRKASKNGLRIIEIPSIEQNRVHGKSNINYFRDGWSIATTVFREALKR